MKWVLIILGLLAFAVLVIYIIGRLLPVKHTASLQFSVGATPDKVWQRLADFSNYPNWRPAVKSITVRSTTEWTEVSGHNDSLPLAIVASEPPNRLATQIQGKSLPYGGGWEFNLQPKGDSTLVTITENGEVYNPIFRFVSKFIMGQEATLKTYAADLQRSFK
jgi:uncharacterized membrane protein